MKAIQNCLDQIWGENGKWHGRDNTVERLAIVEVDDADTIERYPVTDGAKGWFVIKAPLEIAYKGRIYLAQDQFVVRPQVFDDLCGDCPRARADFKNSFWATPPRDLGCHHPGGIGRCW